MRNPKAQKFAIQLRKELTDAERCLWQRLRLEQLNGFKFRRQYPCGSFIADFACVAAKVIVELDGGQHNENRADVARDKWFMKNGWRVLRFWNDQVLKDTETVLESIRLTLETATVPSPARSAGEG